MTQHLIRDDFGNVLGSREITAIYATDIKPGDNIIAHGIDWITVTRIERSNTGKSIYAYHENTLAYPGIESRIQLKPTANQLSLQSKSLQIIKKVLDQLENQGISINFDEFVEEMANHEIDSPSDLKGE